MATLTGFTRNADPISAAQMSTHISSDIGIPVTAEMLPDYTISVTGAITSANTAAIQASILTYVYSSPSPSGMGNTVTVFDDYVCQPNDNSIKVMTTNKDVLITVVAGNTKPQGTQIRVKKCSTDNNMMTVKAASGTIDDLASFSTSSSQKPSYTLEVDNTSNYIRV